MFKFKGTTSINKPLGPIYSSRGGVILQYAYADYEVSLEDLGGTCRISTHVSPSPLDTSTKDSEVKIKYNFKDFKEMFLTKDWQEFNFTIKVGLHGRSMFDLCKIFNLDFVLVRVPYAEGAYNVKSLNSLNKDYTFKNGYVHIGENKNTCLFLGEEENPEFSLVLKDKDTYEECIKRILTLLEVKV